MSCLNVSILVRSFLGFLLLRGVFFFVAINVEAAVGPTRCWSPIGSLAWFPLAFFFRGVLVSDQS